MSLLSLPLFMLPTPPSQQAFALDFGTPINLSNNSGDSDSQKVATSGSNVFVTWTDDTTENSEVLFAASIDSGASFGDPINISNTAGNSLSPQIAVSGSDVFVTYVDNTDVINYDVFVAVSIDSGASFGDPVNVSENDGNSLSPQIAVSGSDVFVVYEDDTTENSEVLVAASFDSGASFGDPVNVSNNLGYSGVINFGSALSIATSGSNVFVTWEDNTGGGFEVFFASSTDSGSEFTSENLSDSAGSSFDPRMAISGSNVFVVWSELIGGTQYDIFMRKSDDGGASFGLAINISNNAGGSSGSQIAASGSNVFVVWTDTTPPGFAELFVAASTDSGASFGTAVNVSNNAGSSGGIFLGQKVTAIASNVFVTWADSTPGDTDIFVAESTDSGASFGDGINVSNTALGSSDPHIAVTGSSAFVTWTESTPDIGDSDGPKEIYYVTSLPAPSDTTPPNHPPLSDLVSWYRAEGNGDDSADNNPGQDDVSYGLGQVGQAFSFDGDGDQVAIDGSSNLDVGTSDGFTIGAWINPDDLISRPVVEYNDGDGGDGVHMWASYPNPGDLYANIKDNTGTGPEANHQITAINVLTLGTFQHVAVTYDATSGEATLYRNGVEVANEDLGIFTPQTTYDLYIGTRPLEIDYSGLIDEVVLYDRALTALELQSIFDAGNAVLINSGDATTTSPDVTLTLVCQDSESGCERIDVTFANIDANIPTNNDGIPIDVYSDTNPTPEPMVAEETGENTAIFILEIPLTDDGSGSTIQFSNGDQITAVGTFFDAAVGTKTVDVVFTDAADNFVTQGDSIELVGGVQPTSLALNPLQDVTATTGYTVSGELTVDDTGEPLPGQMITFSGSGTTPSLQSVMTEGVTFTGTIDIVACPTPAEPTPTTCTTDNIGDDDTTSNNMVLHLGEGGKIKFPASTVTAKIYLQDMGTNSFKYIVEEGNGALQPEATSAGADSPIVSVVSIISGYTSGDPNGIKELTITEITGGTSVGIAAVLTGNPDGLPVEQHQINFEEFGAGPQASPFTVNAGFYFSTGFAQNTDEEGLEITAHFAGTGGFTASDSTTESYDVLANTAGLGGEGSQGLGGAVGTSITTLDCNTDVGSVDSDNDGICDLWETSGITLGGANYPLVGAAVGARDIFVEIDCMTGFCPTNTDLTAVRNAFSAEGFTLHIAVDENNLAVHNPLHVWSDNTPGVLDDFDSIKKAKFGSTSERSGGTLGQGNEFLRAKAQVYHYGLFAQNINTGTNTACGPSGQAELRGNDFIVSVGCTGTNGFANSAQERQGTLMHELGHNLGLRHGGGDDDNCKANLISVMSYTRQMPWGSLSAATTGSNPTEWALTYSRQDLADLIETNLQESAGLTINTGQWGGTLASGSSSFKIIWGIPAVKTGSTGNTVNWNNAAGNTASLNINTLSGMTGCTGTVKSTLKSYDEWTILDLNFRDEGTIDGLVYPDADTVAELTPPVLSGAEAASIVGPNNVFNAPGISILPDVAADADNNIYAVWSEKASFSSSFEIYFSKSQDGGATFSPPENISNNPGESLTPRIAESNGVLYVVWSDKTGGTSNNYDIRFSKSSNMGEDWDPSVKLTSNSGDSLTPSIATSGSSLYVVWSDKTGGTSSKFDIQFKKSTDGGTTFTPNAVSGTKVSSNSGESLTPDVDVSSSGIFVVWSDTSGGMSSKFDILMKKSTDGGTTFLPNTANAKNISTNSGHSLTPSLAVDGDNVYVTWSDTTGGTSGNFDILFKKSTDGGNNFTPNTANAKNISTTSSLSATPRIVASSGSIYIAWSDNGVSGRLDIFVKKSGDAGENFEAAQNISANSGHSLTPAIVLTGPVLNLVWGDFTPGITGDIMYASRIV